MHGETVKVSSNDLWCLGNIQWKHLELSCLTSCDSTEHSERVHMFLATPTQSLLTSRATHQTCLPATPSATKKQNKLEESLF